MPTVNANKHTAHDLQLAGQMRREDYKTIKHMVELDGKNTSPERA